MVSLANMRTLANIGIALGASMILFGPNAAFTELLTVAIPVFAVLQVVETANQRARARRLEELAAQTRTDQKRVQEMLGL